MKLFVDADFTVYKNCASAEYDVDYGKDVIVVQSKFSDALKNVQYDLKRIQDNFFGDHEIVLFSACFMNLQPHPNPNGVSVGNRGYAIGVQCKNIDKQL